MQSSQSIKYRRSDRRNRTAVNADIGAVNKTGKFRGKKSHHRRGFLGRSRPLDFNMRTEAFQHFRFNFSEALLLSVSILLNEFAEQGSHHKGGRYRIHENALGGVRL